MTKSEGMALIAKLAAEGKSVPQTASILNVSVARVRYWAGLACVRFHGARDVSAELAAMRSLAQQDLRREIAEAKALAPITPVYRGGWP